MSLDSKEEGENPHYVYLALIIVPPFPTEISILCHYAETNDISLPSSSGQVGPSP